MSSMKVLILAMMVLAAGCSSGGSGGNCYADSDCGSGVKCIGVGNLLPDGGCMIPSQKLCEKLCTSNSDCGAPDGGMSCGSDCAGTHFCVPAF